MRKWRNCAFLHWIRFHFYVTNRREDISALHKFSNHWRVELNFPHSPSLLLFYDFSCQRRSDLCKYFFVYQIYWKMLFRRTFHFSFSHAYNNLLLYFKVKLGDECWPEVCCGFKILNKFKAFLVWLIVTTDEELLAGKLSMLLVIFLLRNFEMKKLIRRFEAFKLRITLWQNLNQLGNKF